MDGNTMARNLRTPFGKQRNGVSIWMIRSGKPISFTELQNSNPKVNYLVTFGIETASIFSKLFSIHVKRSLKEREGGRENWHNANEKRRTPGNTRYHIFRETSHRIQGRVERRADRNKPAPVLAPWIRGYP